MSRVLRTESQHRPSKTSSRVRTLKVVADVSLPVKTASGVAHLANGAFLTVDDDRGVFRIHDGKAQKLYPVTERNGFEDLEAITVDEKRGMAYVVSESSHHVFRFPIDGSEKPERIGTLPSLAKQTARTWEGLAFLPAHLSWDKKDHLVAGHQGQPRRILVLSVPDLEVEAEHKLDGDMKDVLGDIADIAVHPKTGHLFVLSDVSLSLVELKLTKSGLELISAADVPLKGKQHVEGVGFKDANTVTFVCDESSRMVTAKLG